MRCEEFERVATDVTKKCEAFLGKGGSRLWKTMVFRERPSPFLKSRPADAFRDILCNNLASEHRVSGRANPLFIGCYSCRMQIV